MGARWSDGFEGPEGAPPDPATWSFQLGDGSAQGLAGWGNQELQYDTDAPSDWAVWEPPVVVDTDGTHVLEYRAAPVVGVRPSEVGDVTFRLDTTPPRTTVPWPARRRAAPSSRR